MKKLRVMCPCCGRVDDVDRLLQRDYAWSKERSGVFEHTITSGGFADIQNEIRPMNDSLRGREVVAELVKRVRAFLKREG